MVISQIYKGQGFGNQLWCMTTAYALSQFKNFPISFVDSSQSFLGYDIFDFPTNFFKKKIKVNNYFYEEGYYDTKLKNNLFFFDKSILNIKPFTEIVGNFQSENYFFNKEEKIKNYFKINEKTLQLSEQFNNHNILNIRGGEYKRHRNLLLPDFYWQNLYSLLKSKSDLPFVIVTDDYSYSRRLFPNLDIISNDIQLCFAAIMGSSNIGLSNSSFSYFPIFFGKKKQHIFAPYQWARFNNSQNLWVSPCNYYQTWQWVNSEGLIISSENCLKNISFTKNILEKKCKKIHFALPKSKHKFVINIKTFIKYILGFFNWRYQ